MIDDKTLNSWENAFSERKCVAESCILKVIKALRTAKVELEKERKDKKVLMEALKFYTYKRACSACQKDSLGYEQEARDTLDKVKE